jgi:hypothetical protein
LFCFLIFAFFVWFWFVLCYSCLFFFLFFYSWLFISFVSFFFRVSAEDARAKIEAKLEKAREGSAAPAVVASDSTLVTQRAATPPIISSASRAIRGPLLADCEVTLVSWTPDEAGFPLRGCPCGTEEDTQDVHGAVPG